MWGGGNPDALPGGPPGPPPPAVGPRGGMPVQNCIAGFFGQFWGISLNDTLSLGREKGLINFDFLRKLIKDPFEISCYFCTLDSNI